jgi:hypothetical protein
MIRSATIGSAVTIIVWNRLIYGAAGHPDAECSQNNCEAVSSLHIIPFYLQVLEHDYGLMKKQTTFYRLANDESLSLA